MHQQYRQYGYQRGHEEHDGIPSVEKQVTNPLDRLAVELAQIIERLGILCLEEAEPPPLLNPPLPKPPSLRCGQAILFEETVESSPEKHRRKKEQRPEKRNTSKAKTPRSNR